LHRKSEPSDQIVQSNILELLSKSDYSKDITFLVGIEQVPIHAHKCILAERTEVFKNMFYFSGMKETKESLLKYPDYDPFCFKVFIEFFYIEKIPDISENYNCSENEKDEKQISIKAALDIMELADKYKLPKLFNMLQSSVKKKIYIQNLKQIFNRTAVEMQIFEELFKYTLNLFIDLIFYQDNMVLIGLDIHAILLLYKNGKEHLNSRKMIDNISEYCEKQSVKEIEKLLDIVKEIVEKEDIMKFSSDNLKFCIRHNLISVENILDRLLPCKNSNAFNSTENTGIIYEINCSLKVLTIIKKYTEFNQPSIFSKIESYFKVPESAHLLLKNNCEDILKKYYCAKHRQIHAICNLTTEVNPDLSKGIYIIDKRLEALIPEVKDQLLANCPIEHSLK